MEVETNGHHTNGHSEKRRETSEERRIRKEKEKKARANETEEERRIRKEKEKNSSHRKETEEERRIRKEKEKWYIAGSPSRSPGDQVPRLNWLQLSIVAHT